MSCFDKISRRSGKPVWCSSSAVLIRRSRFSFIWLVVFSRAGYEVHFETFRSLCLELRPPLHYAGFTLKIHQMYFPSTLPWENLKTQLKIGHIWFLKTWSGKSPESRISRRHFSRKAPFWKCSPSTWKRKAAVFPNYSGLKSVFEKLLFSWRISVDREGLTVKIKLRFQISPRSVNAASNKT